MTIERAQVESFLNILAKFDGAKEIARVLLSLDDVNSEISTAQARLAEAKQKHANELGEHADQLVDMRMKAEKAAAEVVEAANAEAGRVIDSVHADIDRLAKQHAVTMEHRNRAVTAANDQLQAKNAERQVVEANLAEATDLLAQRRTDLAAVEAQLASAREAIASLLKG